MIETVLGKKKIEDLGYILPHEHIFIDLTNEFSVPEDPFMAKICYDDLSLKNIGYIKYNPYLMKDNFILDNEETMLEELVLFKEKGGGCIIDNTNKGINRDVLKLKRMSENSGVHIICGCGYYTGDTFPKDFNLSPQEIRDEIINEFENGIDNTGIKPGIIGEIGTGKVISENEKKSLIGSAMACKDLQAPMQVHLHPWGVTGLEVLDIIKPIGIDYEKLVICHTDVELNIEYMKKLMDSGVYVQFDNIGKEFFIPESGGFADGPFASDRERCATLKELCDCGYSDRILLSNDICLKQMLHNYGGLGYDYLLTSFSKFMAYYGISENIIHNIMYKNPINWLKN